MSELTKLNDEILELDMEVLQNSRVLNENKKNIELMKFTFKNTLDKKEYSNDDKREFAAINQTDINASIKALQDFEYTVRVAVIELEYKKRLFNILMKVTEV